jgi:hypothetical protein
MIGQLRQFERLPVQRDLQIRPTLEDDLGRVRDDGRARFERQLDVEAALREGKRGKEDDEQHEQDVDEGRDVHLGRGRREDPPHRRVGGVVQLVVVAMARAQALIIGALGLSSLGRAARARQPVRAGPGTLGMSDPQGLLGPQPGS